MVPHPFFQRRAAPCYQCGAGFDVFRDILCTVVPCTEHSRTAVRWGCEEEQHHGLGRHAAVHGARAASSVMGCTGRRINTYAPNVRVYWYDPSVQDLIYGVSSFRAVELHMLCCGTIIIGVSVGDAPTFQRTSTDNRKVSAR